jgi:hypothetical protein
LVNTLPFFFPPESSIPGSTGTSALCALSLRAARSKLTSSSGFKRATDMFWLERRT